MIGALIERVDVPRARVCGRARRDLDATASRGMALARASTRAAGASRRATTRDARAATRGDARRARAAIAAYDCVEFVDDSDGREGTFFAVVDVRDDGRETVVRALRRSDSEPRVWVEDEAVPDEVVKTSALRRVESDFSQRKEDRRLDPHGERAVDAWALAED